MQKVLRRVPTVAATALLATALVAVVAGLTADTASTAYVRLGAEPTGARSGAVTHKASPRPVPTSKPASLGPEPRGLIVPDLAVVVPAGITEAKVSAIARLRGVRAVLAVDGGQVQVNGHRASVLGVPLPAFRSWTPPITAAAGGLWAVLAAGNLVTASGSATTLGVSLGGAYRVAGATSMTVPVLATAPLGIPGIDALVSAQRGTQLGLARRVMVLVNAPGSDYTTLVSRIRRITGAHADVINLVPVVRAGTLPVLTAVGSGQPQTYLQLYQDSAAMYCPGLSWTVLAAIGEIESDDGANDGPSSAGALGPMQFMPGTWAEWGTAAFGYTGLPDIMNPFDAVPSATRMLCADGARDGTAGLATAIYAYNHATWYVSEVLNLAAEYAREYPQPPKGR